MENGRQEERKKGKSKKTKRVIGKGEEGRENDKEGRGWRRRRKKKETKKQTNIEEQRELAE